MDGQGVVRLIALDQFRRRLETHSHRAAYNVLDLEAGGTGMKKTGGRNDRTLPSFRASSPILQVIGDVWQIRSLLPFPTTLNVPVSRPTFPTFIDDISFNLTPESRRTRIIALFRIDSSSRPAVTDSNFVISSLSKAGKIVLGSLGIVTRLNGSASTMPSCSKKSSRAFTSVPTP